MGAATFSAAALLACITFESQQLSPLRSALLACCTLLGTVMAWHAWRNAPSGRLQWDGQHWIWSGFGETPVRQLTLHLDFQGLMLLQIQSESGVRQWLWLERTRQNSSWIAMRRAIVAATGESSSASSIEVDA